MSLVASTGGVTLVPLYAQNMLAPNVVARALEGSSPTVDLALGYNQANSSPLLYRLLSRADELVTNVQNQSIIRYVEAARELARLDAWPCEAQRVEPRVYGRGVRRLDRDEPRVVAARLLEVEEEEGSVSLQRAAERRAVLGLS